MNDSLILSSSPQWRDHESIQKIMVTVSITLIPAWALSVYFFGFAALYLTIIGILSAVLTEWSLQKIFKAPITIKDGSAVLTGLLLSFNLPPEVPFWIPIVGSFFAISIGKLVFGGLGNNPLNPALVGRAFLMASWPVHMTSKWNLSNWIQSKGSTLSGLPDNMIGQVTQATPLNLYKTKLDLIQQLNEVLKSDTLSRMDQVTKEIVQAKSVITSLNMNWKDLLFGNIGGCIGETSAAALFLGGLFLIYKRYIDWRIPFYYIFTVGFLGWIFGGYEGFFSGNFLFHLLSGGLFLGAFYMATDMVTSPLTKKGKAVFAVGCGLITILIRLKGGYPEGVSYSILLMNLFVPLIDRYMKPKKFGEVTNGK